MTGSAENWPSRLPDCVQVERRGAVAIVRLNRPAKRNALSDELVLGLQDVFATVPEDLRAIVLAAAGDHFCAGVDLNELKDANTAKSLETVRIGQSLNDTVQFCRVPVIAVLHGAVIGGGLELAAAAHIRVAESTAFFALPEATRGIFLGSGGSMRLPKLIGVAAVVDMMLTGRVYDATEAHDRLRLTQYIVEAGAGLAKALVLAEQVSTNARLATFGVIQALPRIAEQDPSIALLTEMLMVTLAQGDEEARHRLRDFLDHKKGKVTR